MKKSFWMAIVLLQGLVIVLLAAVLWHASPPLHFAIDDDAHPSAPAAGALQVEGLVHLEQAIQQASGIVVAPTQLASLGATNVTYGRVLPGVALADARQRLRQMGSERDQAELSVQRAELETTRLQRLWNEDGNVARRLVDQSAFDLEQARQHLRAIKAQGEGVADTVRADWGETVLRALAAPDAGVLAEVLAGQQSLVLIGDGSAPSAPLCIAEHPETCVTARRVAAAPQAESTSSTQSWFWIAPAANLRSGMRVALQGRAIGSRAVAAGLRIPESAIVWQAGQAWVYVPRDATHFERRAVELGGALPGGWFIAASHAALPAVVVQGAQLMLSEESRGQIRNENGD